MTPDSTDLPSKVEAVDFDPFAGAALERAVPTTEAQREVWLADRLAPDASLAYNEAIRISIDGPLDASALRAALQALVERHDALRSTFSSDGLSMLVASDGALPLEAVDLSGAGADTVRDATESALARAVGQPFDLDAGPLVRATLLSTAADAHLLVLAAHHIVCDGWSFGVLARDLARLHDLALGRAAEPMPPADRFADYAARDAARAGSDIALDTERFWVERFADGAPVLDLPTDRPRPAVRGFASRRLDRRLDPALVAELKRFGGRQGASLFGVLAGVFAACIARISGQCDVVLGVPAAGQSASGMHALVGHCVNLLPIRVPVDGTAEARALVGTAQSAVLDAFEHQEFTFGTLLKRLQVVRDPGRLPLVSVMFNLDQALEGELPGFTGLRTSITSVPRRFENFELFVNATQERGGLVLECQYVTGLFDEATIDAWLGAFESMLRGLLAAPDAPVDALPMLDAGQRARLDAWNATDVPFDREATVVDRVLAQADRTPQAPAVIAGRARLTYAELAARVHRIAHALRARGVRRGDRVGLCLERGVDLVAALLGAHEAGAAYVPLDPAFPTERLAYMAEDAALALLVTESTVSHRVPWPASRTLVLDHASAELDALPALAPDGDDLRCESRGEDVAYVIYTSGSTGKPKGVVVPHRAVGNFLETMARSPGLAAGERLVAVTTLSFDIAVLELLLPLTVGATVVVAAREEVLDGLALRERIESTGATAMQATPAGWRVLLDAGWPGVPGFKALVGGEALPADLARRLLDRCGEVWNMYGPTETTVWSTTWRVASPERGVFIGRPIGNTRVDVRDEAGRPVPIGVPGELWIGGDGVALGYRERPELTADRFVADVGDDGSVSLMYRTGDRGRWRADGLLEHLGRLDSQVKVRGFRIELGEIETALRLHPAVGDAVAIVREDRPGDLRLAAYWVPRASAVDATDATDAGEFATHLKRTLPDYMVPQHFVRLTAVPRLPNGKLDRRALPAPDAAPASSRTFAEPSTETERLVAAIVEKALGLPGVGLHDDFFMLGGHSLLAAQVVAQLNRRLGLRLSMRALFEAPTVERLARLVERETAPGPRGADRIMPRADRDAAPLSLNQERLWFLERLQPGRTVYNTPSAHRLRGRLDVQALGRAFQAMVDRHEVLRTTLESTGDGGAIQRIHPRLDASTIPVEDLSALPEAGREAAARERIDALIDVPFELSRAPLFVIRLFRLAPEEHWLLFMPHHAIWDGWSFDLFYEEMSAGYLAALDGRPSSLPALETSYGDFAAWQHDWLASDEFTRQVEHWRARFAAGADAPQRPLMTDRPRGAVMTGEGRTEWLVVDRRLTERLREFGRETDATLFMTLLTAYTVQLASLGALGRQMIGIPVRGRSTAETEPLMGYFTNLLPLRLELRREDTFRALQDRVRSALLEAFAFPDVPLEKMMERMPELRGSGPLYQALFSFQDARRRPQAWGNLRHERIEVSQRGATEDIGLWLVERADGLVGGVTYHADLYDDRTARRLRERFVAMLARVVDAPDATVDALLDLDADERRRLDAWLAGSGVRVAATDAGDDASAGQDGPTTTAAAVGSAATQAAAAPGRTPPVTDTERRIAEAWSGLLGTSAVYREDNFFDLGGHSLLVMQAVDTLERSLQRRIDPRRYIFESLAQIAAGYDAAAPVEAPRRGLVGRLLSGLKRT